MAKKKSPGITALVLIAGALFLLSQLSLAVWMGLGAVGFVIAVIYSLIKERTASVPPDNKAKMTPPSSARNAEAPVTVTLATASTNGATTPSRYALPDKPMGYGEGLWYPSGMSINIGGVPIPGGMVYVGTSLTAASGSGPDPCLIDPSKTVASKGDFTQRMTDYWPSYSKISPEARRAYLNWLINGKNHPRADLGYVFLYFYGLERRAIIDAAKDVTARAELPILATEIRRLLNIYGPGSTSFESYASGLLAWIEGTIQAMTPRSDVSASFSKLVGDRMGLRLTMGQLAKKGLPVPVELARAWGKSLLPARTLREITRCDKEFNLLYATRYKEQFEEGVVHKAIGPLVTFSYQPASAGFQSHHPLELELGGIHDVTYQTGPLCELASSVAQELIPYSRYLATATSSSLPLEALILLPACLWPPGAHTELDNLKERIAASGAGAPLTLEELSNTIGYKKDLTPDQVKGLATLLETIGLGIEPDVLGGARISDAQSKIVVFSIPDSTPCKRDAPGYALARVGLELAALLLPTGTDFSSLQLRHLQQQVAQWPELTGPQRQRLSAYSTLVGVSRATLPAIKKKVAGLPADSKEVVASLVMAVVQMDGEVSPAAVKMLEKIYKLLGLDATKVFSDIHQVATKGASHTKHPKEKTSKFQLDHERIASLQEDSHKASKLLAKIFTEEALSHAEATEVAVQPVPQPSAGPAPFEPANSPTVSLVMGLDAVHSALARKLVTRAQWSRQELLDITKEMGLMLDGALECINEAAFDAYDGPLTEGEDPVEVNVTLLDAAP